MTLLRSRGGLVAMAALLVVALFIAGLSLGSSSEGIACLQWCGEGSATVTFGGTTTTIAGGGCADWGVEGMDARFGDWRGVAGLASYLEVQGRRAGGPTPTPARTSHYPVGATETQYPSTPVSGSVNGVPFVLDASAVVTFNSDGTGSFFGNDMNDGGPVSGTFVCG